MSTNQVRKPSQAAEKLFTFVVILIIVTSGFLYFYFEKKAILHPHSPVATQAKGNEENSSEQNPFVYDYAPSNSDELRSNPIPSINNMDVPAAGLRRAKSFANRPVQAPLPAFDVKPRNITVDAAAGQVITSPYKSKILIPPYAFVNKDGNIVTGNVDVKYREFHNYFDIFLSGIPMHYDTIGSDQLESAGMIELTASQGDEPLYVNRESKIKVMLSTMNRSADYNLYFFDKAKNSWIYKGKDMVTADTEGTAGWKFTDTWRDSTEKRFWFYPAGNPAIRCVASIEEPEKRKWIFSKKTGPTHFVFHFMANYNSLPETRDLSHITWRYTGDDAVDVFSKLFGDNPKREPLQMVYSTWNSIDIQHDEEDDMYIVSAFSYNDTVSVKVIPRVNSERGWKRFYTCLDKYNSERNTRLEDERTALQRFQADTAKYYAENGRYIVRTGQGAEYFAMRQFEVDGFGIWNCDRPMEMPQQVQVLASFVDGNGKPLRPVKVFLALKSNNTVYTYTPDMLNKFKFSKQGDNMVWALFGDNNIAIIRPDEFNRRYASSRGQLCFKINRMENAQLTKEELKQKLRFDL